MALPRHIFWNFLRDRVSGRRHAVRTPSVETSLDAARRNACATGSMGGPAPVVVGEDVPHGAPGELYLFAVRPTDPEGDCLQMRPEIRLYLFAVRATDPDVLVIIADRHGLAGRGPGSPCGVNPRQVVLRFILPVQDRSPLIADQDLFVRREAVIIVARSEEAICAKKLGVIEQLRLSLMPAGCRSERDWRGQRGGQANRRPESRADKTIPHRPILACCRTSRQSRSEVLPGGVPISHNYHK